MRWLRSLLGLAVLLVFGLAAPPSGHAATLPAPDLPGQPLAPDQELASLIQLDDLVHEEIEQWLDQAATNRFNDTASRAALNLKIKQRREIVKAAYEKFLKNHPDHVRARILFGSFLREAEWDKEALAQWEEARRLAPTNAVVWNNLGNYYGEEGPVTNALACYAKAIELDPRQPLYHQNLARNLLLHDEAAAAFLGLSQQQIIRRAQEHFRRVCELSPTNFPAATELAQSFYALRLPLSGRHADDWQAAQQLADESLAAWDAALKLAGGEKERQGVLVHRARIQISAERWDGARQTLAQITDPSLAGLKIELEARLAAREKSPQAAPPPKP